MPQTIFPPFTPPAPTSQSQKPQPAPPQPSKKTPIGTTRPFRQLSRWELIKYFFRDDDFYPDEEDATNLNGVLVGQPGTGKTELAIAKVKHAIEVGESCLLLDRHNDAFAKATALAVRMLPPEKVIFIDPTEAWVEAFGMPALTPHIPENGESAAPRHDDLVSFLRSASGSGLEANRMASLSAAIFRALSEFNEPLSSAGSFITNPAFRQYLLQSEWLSPEMKEYWRYMFGQLKNRVPEWLESSRSRLEVFNYPFVRPMFSHIRPSVDLRKAFDDGCLILVNLSNRFFRDPGTVSMAAGLFPFLAKQALVPRNPLENNRHVHLIWDEVVEYWNAPLFLSLLSGMRKYEASSTLLFQSVAHMRELSLVTGSVGHLVAFACSDIDARLLGPDLGVFGNSSFVKNQEWDWRGAYGLPEHYRKADIEAHLLQVIKDQRRGEACWRIKTVDEGNKLYLAKINPVEIPDISYEEEYEFRKASAKVHHPPF